MSEEGGDGEYYQDSNVYTETTHESYGQRLGNSCQGLCFGPLLMVASMVLLFWNEGRAVHRYKDLQDASKMVQSVSDASYVDSSLEGKLVHVSGRVQADAYLYDNSFGVQQDAIKLSRRVETYQWVEDVSTETKKNTGGSTTTTKTYNYRKEWQEGLIDSTEFKESTYHENPDSLLFEEVTLTANEVTLGAYSLSQSMIDSMSWWTQVKDLSADNAPQDKYGHNGLLFNHAIYYGDDPLYNPAVGDTRVSFYVVPTGKLSIIARQEGSSFVPYYTKRGGQVILIEQGLNSAEAMIENAQMQNRMITWLLRAVGVAISFAGFQLLFKPLTTFADVLPFLGNILEKGVIPCLGFVVSGTISLIVISIAWFFYRPIVGACILGVVGVIVFLVVRRANEKKYEQETFGSAYPEKPPAYNPQATYTSSYQQGGYPQPVPPPSGAYSEPEVYVPGQPAQATSVPQGGSTFAQALGPVKY